MIFETIFIIFIFLFSVIIHEIAHGEMANILGDPTARISERLTLNPLKHLDPFGSIILPGFLLLFNFLFPAQGGIIFGWAKPVPVNPYNFRDQKYGSAKVAIAGPAANIFLVLIFSLLIKILPSNSEFFLNLKAIFSLIVWVNLILALFNLMPIPPLDGSHILFAFLPSGTEKIKIFFQAYGPFLLIFFIIFGFQFLLPVIDWLFRILVG
ncbi:hypothetical protein AMJ49_01860 [Parcubacteria bacterium DG_74_2]|nr:MAG: hypothetical protein AMJ49_01860 [Parcubacteria bacterium DG_74_2]